MPLESSSTSSKLQPCKLTDDQLLAIGRLIRACAEIEDLINLYLCRIADISEAHAIILLGRISGASRLKLAETFAVTRGEAVAAQHKACFGDQRFSDITRCRNTVAHGILLGKTENGEIAFQIHEPQADEGRVIQTVDAYSPDAFKVLADRAEHLIPQFVDILMLGPSLQTRQSQALGPHRRARAQAKQKAKHAHPRPPSGSSGDTIPN